MRDLLIAIVTALLLLYGDSANWIGTVPVA
jgi:hypothetical protein